MKSVYYRVNFFLNRGFRDPRQPAVPLRVHSSTHSDDITTLSFHPEGDGTARRNIILSGSSDGLLCTSYADEDDEEEAIVHVGNLGSSISQAGWIHGANYGYPDQAGIWAATDMETFSTWTREVYLADMVIIYIVQSFNISSIN